MHREKWTGKSDRYPTNMGMVQNSRMLQQRNLHLTDLTDSNKHGVLTSLVLAGPSFRALLCQACLVSVSFKVCHLNDR